MYQTLLSEKLWQFLPKDISNEVESLLSQVIWEQLSLVVPGDWRLSSTVIVEGPLSPGILCLSPELAAS